MTALFTQIEMPTKIKASDLVLSRGDNILFEGLSVTISAGDVLWIQGNNGIGKTTLLEAFAGLSRPDSGELRWSQGGMSTTASHIVAYQPHRSFAKATLTVREDLMFWAKIIGRESIVVDESIQYVGLSNHQFLTTQSLSAGQLRRLALAKLIISDKAIWIMDEPAAPMDASGTILIDDIISQHANRGGIVIIASHATPRKLSIHTRKIILKSAS